MTDQQILEKAIKKATDGGWRLALPTRAPITGLLADYHFEQQNWRNIIFNHDFAKALWGGMPINQFPLLAWEFHLQQMVIADDPIRYLGEHLG